MIYNFKVYLVVAFCFAKLPSTAGSLVRPTAWWASALFLPSWFYVRWILELKRPIVSGSFSVFSEFWPSALKPPTSWGLSLLFSSICSVFSAFCFYAATTSSCPITRLLFWPICYYRDMMSADGIISCGFWVWQSAPSSVPACSGIPIKIVPSNGDSTIFLKNFAGLPPEINGISV